MKLPDRAFEHVKHLREKVKCKEGVKILLDKLAELFIPDKLGDRIRVHMRLHNMRRKENGCVLKHIEEYMKVFREYRTLCVKSDDYDDSDLALTIMASCELSEADTKTVSAQMKEPPSSDNVIQILKRIFSMTNQENSNKDKNDSDIFLAKAAQVKNMRATLEKTEIHTATFMKEATIGKMTEIQTTYFMKEVTIGK